MFDQLIFFSWMDYKTRLSQLKYNNSDNTLKSEIDWT